MSKYVQSNGFINREQRNVQTGVFGLNNNVMTSSLFDFASYTFTNAGAQGTYGPTLAQCQAVYGGTPWITNYFAVTTQGFQEWRVPANGTYKIKAAGAQGGAGKYATYYGGFGAIMQGTIDLLQNDIIIMAIGQRGGSGINGSAGGGGGTFVAKNNRSTLLIVAGGGGGGGGNSNPVNGFNGVTTMSGGANSSGGAGGSSGAGAAGYGGGGGGGGYTSAGATGADVAGGGSYFASPGTMSGGRGGQCTASQTGGGSTNYNSLGHDQGGFGGGGGGEWCSQGAVGGGGGYSGGAGNSNSSGVGGGGGSYFHPSVTNRYTSNGLYEGSSMGITTLDAWNGVPTLNDPSIQSNGYVYIERVF